MKNINNAAYNQIQHRLNIVEYYNMRILVNYPDINSAANHYAFCALSNINPNNNYRDDNFVRNHLDTLEKILFDDYGVLKT